MPWPTLLNSVYEIKDTDLVDGGPPTVDPVTSVQMGAANTAAVTLAQRDDHLLDLIERGAHGGQVGHLQALLAGVTPLHTGYVPCDGGTIAAGAWDPALPLRHVISPVALVDTARRSPAAVGEALVAVEAGPGEMVALVKRVNDLVACRSADGGATWTSGAIRPWRAVPEWAVDLIHAGDRWYALVCGALAADTWGCEVWSSPTGATWTLAGTLAGGTNEWRSALVAATGPRILLSRRLGAPPVNGDGWLSADGGATWTALALAAEPTAGVYDAARGWLWVQGGTLYEGGTATALTGIAWVGRVGATLVATGSGGTWTAAAGAVGPWTQVATSGVGAAGGGHLGIGTMRWVIAASEAAVAVTGSAPLLLGGGKWAAADISPASLAPYGGGTAGYRWLWTSAGLEAWPLGAVVGTEADRIVRLSATAGQDTGQALAPTVAALPGFSYWVRVL